MKLNAPGKLTFYISVILLILGLLLWFNVFTIPSVPSTYALVASWIVLAAGCILTGH